MNKYSVTVINTYETVTIACFLTSVVNLEDLFLIQIQLGSLRLPDPGEGPDLDSLHWSGSNRNIVIILCFT